MGCLAGGQTTHPLCFVAASGPAPGPNRQTRSIFQSVRDKKSSCLDRRQGPETEQATARKRRVRCSSLLGQGATERTTGGFGFTGLTGAGRLGARFIGVVSGAWSFGIRHYAGFRGQAWGIAVLGEIFLCSFSFGSLYFLATSCKSVY